MHKLIKVQVIKKKHTHYSTIYTCMEENMVTRRTAVKQTKPEKKPSVPVPFNSLVIQASKQLLVAFETSEHNQQPIPLQQIIYIPL